MNYYYGMVWLLGLFLWQSPLYSQSVNLDSFQKIQLMSLEECALVQVNASWNYANRLKIEKLKDCYIAEIDLANKNIGAVIQKEWNIKTVPTIIILEKGKEVMRFEAGISMKFKEDEVLKKIKEEIFKTGKTLIKSGEYEYPITLQLIKDGKKNKVLNKRINSGINVTMIHGQNDEFVPIVLSRYVLKIFNKAGIYSISLKTILLSFKMGRTSLILSIPPTYVSGVS